MGWESVAGGWLSVALVVEGWEGSCCPCLRSILCSAVVMVESGGEAGGVGSGWEGLAVLSGDGGSTRGAKAGVEASGEVDVWSLREAGVCVSSAVVLGGVSGGCNDVWVGAAGSWSRGGAVEDILDLLGS